MTDVRSFIVGLHERGIKLVLEGDALKSRARPGAIDAATGGLIRAHKQEIIEFLRRRGEDRDIVPADRGGPLALSFAQRRLWLVDQIEGSAHYVLPVAIRLRGALDRAAFRSAIDSIVQRHESLRTVFLEHDGEPQQQVLRWQPLPVAEHDLRGLEPESREQQLQALRQHNATQAFDLKADVMVRVSLVRLDEQEWMVLAVMHHIASDGWSINLFLKEFSLLYAAACRGEAATLEPLPVQYADFAQWQQAQARSERFVSQLDYWRKRLAGLPQVHGIPLDHARPAVKGTEALRIEQRLDLATAERLRALGQRHSASLFMVLHAAFAVTVAHWSRSADVVVGTAISGRTHQKLVPMIGFFANTLVLRTAVDREESFSQLLARSRDDCLQAYEHQEAPFDRIVEVLQPERSASYTPVIQLVFSMPQVDHRELDCAGLQVEVQPPVSVRSLVDLDVAAMEDAQGILLRWDADCKLFETATIERIVASYERVLAQSAADASVRVGDLHLVPEADLARLAQWNATQAPYPSDRCVHELVEQQAARTPDRLAIACGDIRISYAELDGKANALATQLIAAGARPGEVAAVIMPPGAAVPVSFLALMKAAVAFAPLDIDWPRERLDAALRQLGGPLVLVDEAFGPDAISPEFRRHVVRLHALGRAPAPQVPVRPEDPVYVMHTSGSTGVPKGALNAHRGIVNRLSFMSRYFNDQPDEVVLQITHHCFDSAVWQFFWPLTKGGSCVMPVFDGGFDLGLLVRLLREHRVTMTDFSPALLGLFADHLLEEGLPEAERSSLRHLVVGGEVLTLSIARKCAAALPAVRLHNFYGPSETSIGCVCHAIPVELEGSVPIGRPIDNVVVAVVDGALKPVAVGAPGELLIGGDCVGSGYVGNPEATRRAFVELAQPLFGCRRYYRSGDLVRHRNDGVLEFLGRTDSQVKIRGFRIELSEVQTVLEAQPGVRQAHVQIADEGQDARIVAYVVPADTSSMEADEEAFERALKAGAARRLPDYMVPSACIRLDKIPLLPNGKVNRGALARAQVPARERTHVVPASIEERTLAAIWCELFRLERVGKHDDFFELGGHSLLATQMAARVRQRLALELPLRAVFSHSRLDELARWCAEARGAAPATTTTTTTTTTRATALAGE